MLPALVSISALFLPPATGEAAFAEAAAALSEARCLACHAAGPELTALARPRPAPSLERAGERLSPDFVRATLLFGHAPDVLGGLDGPARGPAADALVQHLATRGGGFDARPVAALPFELERGRAHYHELGCVACHGPLEAAEELEYALELVPTERRPMSLDFAPPRPIAAPSELARRTNVPALAGHLRAGHRPELRLGAEEARELALYLLRDQALDQGAAPPRAPGLAVSYYEARFEQPAPDFDALTPTRQGRVDTIDGLPEHRADHFGFRFEGWLEVTEAGEHLFATSSDDGSRLYVDGALVVQNDGFHAMSRAEGRVTLEPGPHALVVTMFERDGGEGLEVRWRPPGGDERRLDPARLSHDALRFRAPAADFVPDSSLAAEGARLYETLRCGACHDGAPPTAKAVEELQPSAYRGCVGPEPADGAPRYRGEERVRALEALQTAAAFAAAGVPVTARERLDALLERNACTACHARQGAGGPARAIWPWFVTRGNADLGDEGRIPPTLDEAGGKLLPDALRAVLLDGATARPYMATRMPRFPADEAAEIAELLLALDVPAPLPAPEFRPEDVEHGRRLAGVRGLACIQCHELAGHPSLGIPAVDLAKVHERLSYQWFKRLLDDPIGLNMNTRMPEFWSGGKSPVADVLGGDPTRQVEALWTWLSLGDSMPLPDGLLVEDAVYELVPKERPITCGVFMEGVSPRTLVVGFPKGVHYAFDIQDSRLAKVWRGRFFNTRGTWEGRAGVLQSPPVETVLELPAGLPLAFLEQADAAWPLDAQARARGRKLDAHGTPSFEWALGDALVRERLEPELRAGGSALTRRLEVTRIGPEPPALWARLAVGDAIRADSDGVWIVEAALPHRVSVRGSSVGAAGPRLFVTRRDGRDELRAALTWTRLSSHHPEALSAALEVELSW